jgi:hypothetical protein
MAHDLWVDELQANAAKEKPGEQQYPGPLRAKVVDEQVPVLFEWDFHAPVPSVEQASKS